MGWEQRGNHSYYYRKERDGSRVRSVYVGGGQAALLSAQLDDMQRQESRLMRMERQRGRIQFEKQNEAIDAVDAVCKMNDAVIEAMLIVAGFHTHKRQWRKTRKCQPQPKL